MATIPTLKGAAPPPATPPGGQGIAAGDANAGAAASGAGEARQVDFRSLMARAPSSPRTPAEAAGDRGDIDPKKSAAKESSTDPVPGVVPIDLSAFAPLAPAVAAFRIAAAGPARAAEPESSIDAASPAVRRQPLKAGPGLDKRDRDTAIQGGETGSLPAVRADRGDALKGAGTSRFSLEAADKSKPATVLVDPQALAPLVTGPAQNALAAASAGINGLAQRIEPRVGTTGWDGALGQKVVWMVNQNQQSASLHLNPPDLGPLQVVLHVNKDQASALFVSAQPEVRHALEAAMPQLRAMLADNGIALGQANVSADTSGQQNLFARPDRSLAPGSVSAARDLAEVSIARSGATRTREGLVDIFA